MKPISEARKLLSPEEFNHYQSQWHSFPGRYRHNTPSGVNHALPVISELFQYDDKPIFRAHVFGSQLRKFDPYLAADLCILPFWHGQHYHMVGEQAYTASSRLVIGEEYDKNYALEVPIRLNWKREIRFDNNMSVELVIKGLRRSKIPRIETGYFTFYDDKSMYEVSSGQAVVRWQRRAYVREIELLKQGNEASIDKLVRKIEHQQRNHRHMHTPRKTLKATASQLIGKLRTGEIPEEELHDYFSLWE